VLVHRMKTNVEHKIRGLFTSDERRMREDEKRSALNGWVCRDEHSGQLHVQFPTQSFHLKYG
jgi:hypothetical protein